MAEDESREKLLWRCSREILERLLTLLRPASRVPFSLSPDGRWLALSVQAAHAGPPTAQERFFRQDGVTTEMIGSHLLVIDTTTGASLAPFPKGSTSWGGQWCPSGDLLVAYVQHEGPACLGVWDVRTRAVQYLREAVAHPFFGFEVPQWTPDGKSVLVKLAPDSKPAESCKRPRPAPLPESSVTVLAYDPASPALEEGGPVFSEVTEKSRCDLGLVDVVTGQVRKLASDWRLSMGRVAPNGRAVAVLRMMEADERRMQLYFDLIVVPLDGGASRTVARHIPQFYYGTGFGWSPDGGRLAYTTAERGRPGELYVVAARCSASRGTAAPLAHTHAEVDLTQETEAPRWAADGSAVYALDRRNHVWEFASDASQARQVTAEIDQEILGWAQPQQGATLALSPDDMLWLFTQDPATREEGLARIHIPTGRTTGPVRLGAAGGIGPCASEATTDGATCFMAVEAAERSPEVWCMHSISPRPERIATINPQFEGTPMGRSRVIEYRGEDGRPLQASLFLPSDAREDVRLPLVVCLYGGELIATAMHRFGFASSYFDDAHVLTGAGYAVLYPDMPMQDRDPLRQLPGLVLPAVDCAIGLGIADPGRLAVMGHSYGSYCVLALLTQSTRFRAAVASAPWGVNLTSIYSVAMGMCETGQLRLGGTPWECREAYIDNSPFFRLDRIHTPVLMVCGTGDGIAMAQGHEAFVGLRRLGQRVEFRQYHGEGHWPGYWSQDNLRDLCGRVLEWLHLHLGNAESC